MECRRLLPPRGAGRRPRAQRARRDDRHPARPAAMQLAWTTCSRRRSAGGRD
jgi:hypothetical protein